MNDRPVVLILGAGINGAALARELALNGVDVVVVDHRDIAAGATAYSSRLIHGGLRYLEYGDFALVRESLGERTRLLRLAPQFVRPLRLFIPVRNRFGGFAAAARRFLGMKDLQQHDDANTPRHRGLWTVRFGLWLYDRYARDPALPKHKSYRLGDADVVPVDNTKYRWICSFSDAQIVYPERFTIAMLSDGRQIAAEQESELTVLTYHDVALNKRTVRIRRVGTSEVVREFEPSAIVNATGAWVERTLGSLGVESKRLMGGTKGSHFVTSHARLQQLLGGRAIYTEAADSRPIFILPFVSGTLIGTTDEPFEGNPADAVATPRELEYLVAAVNDVFPDLGLTADDIDAHYAGVRPLPFSDAATPAAISRRHWLEPNPTSDVPLFSIIGGKLTTCRSLAEEAAATILTRLGLEPRVNSEDREIKESEAILAFSPNSNSAGNSEADLFGTKIPLSTIRRIIRDEWVTKLDDLVERRLMLLYQPSLRRKTIEQLSDMLVEAGLLADEQKLAEVDSVVGRLAQHFGKQVGA
jgi:glycerol-3-phosphate dehydrogenase